jgi:hypothetical protein
MLTFCRHSPQLMLSLYYDFYEALLTKGMQPTMARLTLARKIAAITLIVWKKGARFDPQHLKQQAA